jgi:hypothetical protein
MVSLLDWCGTPRFERPAALPHAARVGKCWKIGGVRAGLPHGQQGYRKVTTPRIPRHPELVSGSIQRPTRCSDFWREPHLLRHFPMLQARGTMDPEPSSE